MYVVFVLPTVAVPKKDKEGHNDLSNEDTAHYLNQEKRPCYLYGLHHPFQSKSHGTTVKYFPPFSFTCHQPFTVADLTSCFFLLENLRYFKVYNINQVCSMKNQICEKNLL